MASSSQGGSGKYAVVGIVLFLLAGGLYWCMGPKPQEEKVVRLDAQDAAIPPPSTALEEQSFEIPEELPDAWVEVPDAGPTVIIKKIIVRDPWGCSGNLEQEAVRRLVEEHRVQVRSCYERQLRQNPMLQGSVNVLVRVESQGTVGDMQLDGSLRDREVLSCMRTIISRIRFPPVTGGNCAIVRIPFSFTPQQ